MERSMKNLTILILLVALCATASFFFFNAISSNAKEPDESEIHKLFGTYFRAIKSGDVDTAIQLVIDTRWNDLKSQREGYQAAAKEDVIYSAKVVSLSPQNDVKYGTIYNARLNVKNKTNGEFEIILPVVKVNGNWKILIQPVDLPPAYSDVVSFVD